MRSDRERAAMAKDCSELAGEACDDRGATAARQSQVRGSVLRMRAPASPWRDLPRRFGESDQRSPSLRPLGQQGVCRAPCARLWRSDPDYDTCLHRRDASCAVDQHGAGAAKTDVQAHRPSRAADSADQDCSAWSTRSAICRLVIAPGQRTTSRLALIGVGMRRPERLDRRQGLRRRTG